MIKNQQRKFPILKKDCSEKIVHEGKEIPIQNLIRPAFDVVAIEYSLTYYQAFTNTLLERIGT